MRKLNATLGLLGMSMALWAIAPAPTVAEPAPATSPATVVEDSDLLGLAAQAFAVGDYNNTIFHANRLLQIDPNEPEAYLLRGRAWAELGYREAAIADIERAAREYAERENATGRELALDSLSEL